MLQCVTSWCTTAVSRPWSPPAPASQPASSRLASWLYLVWFVRKYHILCLAPDHFLAMNFHGRSCAYHVTSVVYNFLWRVVVQRNRGWGSVVVVSLSVLGNQPWFYLFSSLKSSYRVQNPLSFLFRGTGGLLSWKKSCPFYLHLVLMWRIGGAKFQFLTCLRYLRWDNFIFPFNRGIAPTCRSWDQL